MTLNVAKSCRVQRRASSKTAYIPVHHVRRDQRQKKQSSLGSMGGRKLIHQLQNEEFLPDWHGHHCPRCDENLLSSLKYFKAMAGGTAFATQGCSLVADALLRKHEAEIALASGCELASSRAARWVEVFPALLGSL